MRNTMLGLISNRYLKQKVYKVEDMSYCVYFVTDGEYTKIGIAASLPTRVKQLQTGNPRKLTALYVIDAGNQKNALKIESRLHKCFSDKQLTGEWFDVTENEIKKKCELYGYEIGKPISKFDFGVDGIQLV